jgi:hypothetical protein
MDAGSEVSIDRGTSRMIGDVSVSQDFLSFRLRRRAGSGSGMHGEITTWTTNGHHWGALIIAAPVRQLPRLPSQFLLVLDRSRSINGSLLEREREIAHEVLLQTPAFVEATQRSWPFNEHSPLSLQPGVSRQSTALAPASATEASGAAALGSATRRAEKGEASPKSMLRILFPASAIGKRQAATKRRRLFSR